MRLIIIIAVTFFTAVAIAHSDNYQYHSYPVKFYCSSQEEYWTLSFITSSFSRQQILEKSCPTPPSEYPGYATLDLADVYWELYSWNRFVAQYYPYAYYSSYETATREFRADWFIQYITDANDNSAGYALLYGFNNIPKDKKSFLKYWQVNSQPEHAFGLIESESRVSKQRRRWIENFSIPRGYIWGTKDYLRIDPKLYKDPLQNPIPVSPTVQDPKDKHDGEEWIVGMPKFSSATGKRGTLQAYMLFDGNQKRIDKADGDLVEDHTKFKNFSQIRSHGSCIQCHSSGINDPTRNEVQDIILSGQDLYAKYRGKEAIERFHLSDTAKEIKRNNEDYAEAIFVTSFATPEDNAKSFKQIVDKYIEPVNLEYAARELFTTQETLTSAIAFESSKNKKLGPNITGLVHGRKLNRETWEYEYLRTKKVLEKWQVLQNGR